MAWSAILSTEVDVERRKRTYEKPIIRKEPVMVFPLEIMIGKDGREMVCRQCSSCHGCR